MRLGEGYTVKYTPEFYEFSEQHKSLIHPENKYSSLKEGDIFVYIGHKKTDHGCYKIKVIGDYEYRTVKLTPKGRESKKVWYFGRYSYSNIFEYKGKETLQQLEKIKNRSKGYVCQGKSRDFQRQKVYNAEHNLRKYLKEIGKQEIFQTNYDAQQYINFLEKKFKDDEFLNNVSSVKIRHNRRKAGAWAKLDANTIEYGEPEFGLNIITVIHEVTHMFHRTKPAHGIDFASAFLYILKHEFPLAYEKLIEEYDNHKVKYKIK